MTPKAAEEFVKETTEVTPVPLCPELRLHVGYSLFRRIVLSPEDKREWPLWAFLWGSGQAMARYLFDHPELVRDKSVLDLGAGSGIAAVAAGMCEADSVTAAECDEHGQASVRLNARLHDVKLDVTGENLIGAIDNWQVVLAADVFYVREQIEPLAQWFDRLTNRGRTVLVADPKRPHFPADRCDLLEQYEVTMVPNLEAHTSAAVYRWRTK